ncbi:thioredoxin family protein [Algisphaera agarilytica]|uniref:Peroxiredoxin n=1 Tax=Algisphaera agarilytica TaxID=1385975 RepID=A0A7X0LLF5_9BACT|nr:thioredoxin family protein [Algisphaera agarilytica]MBB6429918.1 peroxiredoxin [Algisphaera agarilytica]
MLLNTPARDTAQQATDFTLPDPDGNLHSLKDLMGANGLLIAFICNHCPYVQAIADRLAEDAKTLKAEGVNTVAIMSNDYSYVPSDAPPFMKRFAEQHGFDFPYLVDQDQSIGQAYGAVCTPDFFGFNRHGELQYRGRLDDAHMGSGEGRTPELVYALRQIAETGQGPEQQHPSMGCSIKWR